MQFPAMLQGESLEASFARGLHRLCRDLRHRFQLGRLDTRKHRESDGVCQRDVRSCCRAGAKRRLVSQISARQ